MSFFFRFPDSHFRLFRFAFAFGLVGLLLLVSLSESSAQDLSGITAKRYIVIDAQTGEVIAEKNADERVAIASLTKMFTTIEALERGDLNQVITTNESDIFDANSTTMGFGPGESFTLEELLYGMLLPSGNDAAHAVARALGEQPGDTDDEAVARFVGYMNQRAEDMGLTNTHLINPHGWGVKGHYSTARDLATFAMYAYKYPEFLKIIGTRSYTTKNGLYTLTNTNRMLGSYTGLIGGKTGYDDDSGYCLIEFSHRGDSTMIAVTLDGQAPDIWYQDNAELMTLGFTKTQERISSGQPITAQTLSYRDPDAATILKSASASGSIGSDTSQPNAGAAAAPGPVDVAEASSASVDTQVEAPNGMLSSNWNRWLGFGAALLLIAAAVGFKAYRSDQAVRRSSG